MTKDGQDPETLIALIFRVVDAPHRTLAAAALVALLLSVGGLMRFPAAELARSWELWGGSACLAGRGWIRHRAARSPKTGRPTEAEARNHPA